MAAAYSRFRQRIALVREQRWNELKRRMRDEVFSNRAIHWTDFAFQPCVRAVHGDAYCPNRSPEILRHLEIPGRYMAGHGENRPCRAGNGRQHDAISEELRVAQ